MHQEFLILVLFKVFSCFGAGLVPHLYPEVMGGQDTDTEALLTQSLSLCLPLAGYGQIRRYCPKVGYCSSKCSKADVWSFSSDCRYYCCLPPGWKAK